MKSEDRTKRIARLDKQRLKGARAENVLRDMEPILEARRQAYFQELVTRSRREGRIAEDVVWRMVALDDLVQDLDRDVGGGRVADRKLEEMKRDVGGDTK